jgi:hypothetical protein
VVLAAPAGAGAVNTEDTAGGAAAETCRATSFCLASSTGFAGALTIRGVKLARARVSSCAKEAFVPFDLDEVG